MTRTGSAKRTGESKTATLDAGGEPLCAQLLLRKCQHDDYERLQDFSTQHQQCKKYPTQPEMPKRSARFDEHKRVIQLLFVGRAIES